MNNYDYPLGVDNDNAPWNQRNNPEREIEVTVSLTLSKTMKVKVDDYIVDDDGEIDYSECDLKKAVNEQIVLPHEAWQQIVKPSFNPVIISELKGWDVDDYEVIIE